MVRRYAPTFAVVGVLLAFCSAAAAASMPPVDQWLPEDTVLVLAWTRPKPVLDLALSDQVGGSIAALPVYQRATSEPKFQEFLGLVRYVEATAATDWRTAIRRLLGGGVTLAVTGSGAAILTIDAEDEPLLRNLHDLSLTIARGEAAKKGQADQIASEDYQGVTVWKLPGAWQARVGSRLLMANRAEALHGMLDRRAKPDPQCLARHAGYQAAKEAAGPESEAMVFVNLAAVKNHPAVQAALTPKDPNPLGALLFAEPLDALRASEWAALGLRTQGSQLTLEMTLSAAPAAGSEASSFTRPKQAEKGALPQLAVPRRIAAMSLYRDLHGFYAAKDELFPERTSGLIFFENMMGIFFSGRDLTEEVMAQLGPEVRVVVAEQAYDPEVGTPQVQIPAFAAVFRMVQPTEFTEVAEEAWQKALGLVNFTRGQQGAPGMIIDRPTHGDIRYSVAYFSAKSEKDKAKLDARFNFRPALVSVGEYLVLSSTEGLARDLIDTLQKERSGGVAPLTQTDSIAELDFAQLGSVLQANRGQMVRENMIKEGHSQERAETQIDLLLTILRSLGQTTLELGSREGQTRVSLKLHLNPEVFPSSN